MSGFQRTTFQVAGYLVWTTPPTSSKPGCRRLPQRGKARPEPNFDPFQHEGDKDEIDQDHPLDTTGPFCIDGTEEVSQ